MDHPRMLPGMACHFRCRRRRVTLHGWPITRQQAPKNNEPKKSLERTDSAYDTAVAMVLRNIDSAALVVATHNALSVVRRTYSHTWLSLFRHSLNSN